MARRLPWYGWVGVGGLTAGVLGVALDVLAVRILFYCIAWWSYIVLADAWVWRRRGDSLLRNRSREFAVLAFWSVPLWSLFELINFRLRNWCYINVPTNIVQGAVFSVFAYATVVPGIFETYDLLRAYGIGEGWRMRPWTVRPGGLALCTAVGLAMLVAPLLWPGHAFPLVWGFAVFLFDPLCYAVGRTDSFLAQFERGDPRTFVRLLLAGLVCGGLWELWNFWAYTKWLYTVPFFEDTKWFEMPPLGFLGFPPFALECFVLINLVQLFRRGRGWDTQAGVGASWKIAAPATAAAIVFTLVIYDGIERRTVASFAPRVADLAAAPREARVALVRAGIETPPALLDATRTPGQLTTLAARAGLDIVQLEAAREAARLADLQGLGAEHASALARLGVARVEQLAAQEPSSLAERWRAAEGTDAPSLAQIKIWVRAARAASAAPRA